MRTSLRISIMASMMAACLYPEFSYASGGRPLGPSRADAHPIWKTVTDWHGSSVDLPLSLLDAEKDEDDLKFHGKSDNATVIFSTITESRPGFPGNDPKGDMDLKRSDCDSWPPEYQVLKPNLAAYSCTKGQMVQYYVARYNASGHCWLYVTYPIEKKEEWAPIVQRMSSSMRQLLRREIR